MVLGDEIEIFGPDCDFFTQTLDVLQDEDEQPIASAPHPQQILRIRMDQPVAEKYILRKRKE